jgi:ABC-type lipoprotein release transport system permease subunit
MRNLRSWVVRLLSSFRKRQLDERLDEELRFHLEMQAREHEARGMSPEAARRAARAALAPDGPGWSVESLKEEVRERRGVPSLETLGQDLRYALRMMRKSPVFTAVALLSVAFGVGTNCAIFSVVDALLLKTLPVAGAERLVTLEKSARGDPQPLFSYPAWRLLQQAVPVCSGVMAMTADFTAVVRPLTPAAPLAPPAANAAPEAPAAAAPAGSPAAAGDGGVAMETANAQLVSGNFFSALGIGMAAGRSFTAEEDAVPGGHAVAVISYGYWQRRFGRDPAVVGRGLLVNGLPVTVVGVVRSGFHGVIADAAPDLFLPVTLREAVRFQGGMESDGADLPGRPIWEQVHDHWLRLLARRQPGVSVARASAVLNVLFQRDKEARLGADTSPVERRILRAQTLMLEPAARGLSHLRQPLTGPLLLLMAVAGLVLLIACANLANLLLARADRRQKEMALRLGIGAGRGRLLRQLLTESLLLSGLGAVLGVVFAGWGSRLLLSLASRTPDPISLDVDLDWRKLAFALGVALATGVGFGLAPALRATRVDLASSLKQGGGAIGAGAGAGSPGRGAGGRLGRALVAAQIGLSLVLLIGAGLLVRSLQNLMAVDTGVARDGVVLAWINPHLLGYDDGRLTALYPRLVERLEAVPGVRSASLSNLRLLSGSSWDENVVLPGYTPRPDEDTDAQLRVVTPRYFESVGLPLIAGRAFGPRDRQGAPRVAIVDEAMVRRFWPRLVGAGAPGSGSALDSGGAAAAAASVIGQRFGFGPPANSRDFEIVGVVSDVRCIRLGAAPPPTAYLPVAQRPGVLRDLEVRLAGGAAGAAGAAGASNQLPAGMVASLRQAIAEVEPNLPVFSVITMGEQIERSLARERAVARLTAFFGLLALLLAAIGLYGVMSYSVARRTNEIGLRMALGAPRGRVVGLMMRETAVLIAAGVMAGLAAALATMRLAASQLFGLSAHDPATMAAATLALAAVALAAGFLPARRAADTDPMVALRRE